MKKKKKPETVEIPKTCSIKHLKIVSKSYFAYESYQVFVVWTMQSASIIVTLVFGKNERERAKSQLFLSFSTQPILSFLFISLSINLWALTFWKP